MTEAAASESVAPAATTATWRARLFALTGGERWSWLRHWEFWLAVGIGAFLRLWHLDTAQFLYDQAELMTLARTSIMRGALPVTSIHFSVGLLSPPFSVYLLMPFVALGKDPMAATVAIALWNILGVALCYVFALSYFGRRAAAASSLLLAVCGRAVVFSRYIWQTNFLPPLVILWALTLYAGAVRGRRGWFVPNVVLLTMIVLLHPVGVLLVPVTLAAVLVGPQAPRLREYALGAVGALSLWAPTILWESVSGGADLSPLRSFGGQAASYDLQVVHTLLRMLDAPTFRDLGPSSPFPIVLSGSPYAALSGFYPGISVAVVMLYALSYLVLTGLVLAPARAIWPVRQPSSAWWRYLGAGLGAIWRGVRANATWRAHLLLWLWVSLPPAALLRHSVPVFAHYVMVFYPALFVIAGVAVDWAVQHAAALPHQLGLAARWQHVWQRRRVGQAFVLAAVGLLLVGQATQSALFTVSQASGKFDNRYYGYPLGEVQAADRALDALKRQQGASTVLISNPIWYYRLALEYLLVREQPDRMSFTGNCLVLPAPGTRPALIVSTSAQNLAAALLPLLPGARQVATLPMPGGEPFTVYRIPAGPTTLAGETLLASALYRDAAGNGLRLEGAARVASGALVLRWTALASTPAGQPAQQYRVQVRALAASSATGTFLGAANCASTRWQAGETVFTWVGLPPTAMRAAQQTSENAAPWAVEVLSATSYLEMPHLGPLLVLSDQVRGAPRTLLPPQPQLSPGMTGPASAFSVPGELTPAGQYVFPPSAIGLLQVPG